MATRRSSPKRTTASPATKRTTSRPPRPLTAAPGERIFVLDVPFEEKALASAHGAKWNAEHGWVFAGPALPDPLRRYSPRAYSWQAWLQDELAGNTAANPRPVLDNGSFALRADQEEDVRTLLAALTTGAPEILNSSKTGVGKTPTTIATVKRIPGAKRILVIAPLSAIPGWRNHLREMGDGGKRWVLINFEGVKRLIDKPPAKISSTTGRPVKSKASTVNRQHASNGKPKVAWDVVITDESHLLANAASQRSIAVDKVIEGPEDRPALSIRLSATAGTDPAQLSYLHRGLAFASGERPQASIKMDRYAGWCQARNVAVSVNKRFGTEQLAWEANERDLLVFNRLLYHSQPTWAIRRSPEGWPEQERILVPVELSPSEMDAYETAWEEFAAAMKDLRSAKDSNQAAARRAAQSKGLAAQIRYRQKAGMLRAPYSVDYAISLHRSGHQVAISCEFMGAVEAIRDGLLATGQKVSIFTGQNKETRESERVAFQRGETKFIIFTPDSSFDLHQGDKLVRGNDVPRALVVAQPRWSPKKSLQIEGRTQRSGQAANAHYLFAQDTQEVKVLRAMISGVRSMSVINGDDLALTRVFDQALRDVATALGAPDIIEAVD